MNPRLVPDRDGRDIAAAPPPGDEWWSDADVCRAYPFLKPGTVRWQRKRGRGPKHYKFGPKLVRMLRSDVEAWVRSHFVDPEATPANGGAQ